MEILEIIGLGLIVAINPLSIVGQLGLVMNNPDRRTSIAFGIGWAAGLLLLLGLFVTGAAVLFEALPDARDQPPWLPILGGVAIILIGIFAWRREPRPLDAPPSRMESAFASLTPTRGVLLGAGLAAFRAKNFAAVLAAAVVIGAVTDLPVVHIILAACFVAIGSLAIAAPVVMRSFGGERSDRIMEATHRTLRMYSARITGAVLILIGGTVLLVGLVDWALKSS